MKILFGFSLMAGGGFGLAISIMGSIIVSSSLMAINGLDLSAGMMIFSIIALIGGLYMAFLNN